MLYYHLCKQASNYCSEHMQHTFSSSSNSKSVLSFNTISMSGSSNDLPNLIDRLVSFFLIIVIFVILLPSDLRMKVSSIFFRFPWSFRFFSKRPCFSRIKRFSGVLVAMIDFSFFLGPVFFRAKAFGSGRMSTGETTKHWWMQLFHGWVSVKQTPGFLDWYQKCFA